MPYASDFGPLDISCIYKYCLIVDKLLEDPKHEKHVIYHHTSLIPAKRANSALLAAAYCMIRLQKTADEAWEPFLSAPRFIPFRDASTEGSTFELYIIDCLKGLEKAMALSWFSFDTFNLENYERYSRVENGAMNWIIPDKLLAFVAPSDKRSTRDLTSYDYAQIFNEIGITAVVRLNKEKYNISGFEENGINFTDLYFYDGSVPEEDLVKEFFNIVNNESGAVAVHCKAGLGRTGTLIGCYAIANYGFKSTEYIGWARLCRPGSVLGPQQYFLGEYESRIQAEKKHLEPNRAISPVVQSRGDMSLFEKYRAKFGEMGQADRLVQAMKSAPSSPTGIPGEAPRGTLVKDFGKLRIPNRNEVNK